MSDETKPSWWTPETVDIVRRIRDNWTYDPDSARVLAARLMADGCPHAKELDILNNVYSTVGDVVWAICSLFGGSYQDAYDQLHQIATDMGHGMTVDRLIKDAVMLVRTGEDQCVDYAEGGMDFSNYFDRDVATRFWAALETATGIKPGTDADGNEDVDRELYSCFC